MQLGVHLQLFTLNPSLERDFDCFRLIHPSSHQFLSYFVWVQAMILVSQFSDESNFY